MAAQRYIVPTYLDQLKDEVIAGNSLERYCEETIPIPEDFIRVIPQIQEPLDLSTWMNSSDEFHAAIQLYQEYKNLSPIQATDIYFWESLSHLNLHKYIKSRWPLDGNLTPKFITQHWFISGENPLMRHALSSLWWSVYLSVDEENDNPYELTEVLFRNQTFRTRTYGTSLVFRIREANQGILRYILDHPDLVSNFEEAGGEISKYFNRLGAIKLLASMKSQFFYNEMGRAHAYILKAIQNTKNSN